VRADLERLVRERRVAEETLIFALERLEGARAAEARDVSTFQVLDAPPLPTRKSRPSGTQSLVTFAGLGFLAAFLYEAWKGRRRA
jgi:uncharacterized protein involved in exopolysaccharide biosynthesis